MQLDQKELEAIHDILNTKAWDDLVKGFVVQFDHCNQVIGCNTLEDLNVRKGRLEILQQLIGLRDDIREQLDVSV